MKYLSFSSFRNKDIKENYSFSRYEQNQPNSLSLILQRISIRKIAKMMKYNQKH